MTRLFSWSKAPGGVSMAGFFGQPTYFDYPSRDLDQYFSQYGQSWSASIDRVLRRIEAECDILFVEDTDPGGNPDAASYPEIRFWASELEPPSALGRAEWPFQGLGRERDVSLRDSSSAASQLFSPTSNTGSYPLAEAILIHELGHSVFIWEHNNTDSIMNVSAERLTLSSFDIGRAHLFAGGPAKTYDDHISSGNIAWLISFYRAALNNNPDKQGFIYWNEQMRTGTPAAAVASAFANELNWLTDESYVNFLYVRILGYWPDPAGLSYWMGQVAAHGRGYAMLEFAKHPDAETRRRALMPGKLWFQ